MSTPKKKTKKKPSNPYKAISLKSKISPETAMNTVKKIMEIVGFTDLNETEVKELCHYIESGFLQVEGNDLFVQLHNSIPDVDGNQHKRFRFKECLDGELVDNDVDMIEHVRDLQSGKDVNSNTIRTIVRLSLGIQEDFATGISTKDLMVVYALYSLFFIGL